MSIYHSSTLCFGVRVSQRHHQSVIVRYNEVTGKKYEKAVFGQRLFFDESDIEVPIDDLVGGREDDAIIQRSYDGVDAIAIPIASASDDHKHVARIIMPPLDEMTTHFMSSLRNTFGELISEENIIRLSHNASVLLIHSSS